MEFSGYAGKVVAVIGGAGFLGQHLVRELQLSSDFSEIRVFDIKLFTKSLVYEEKKQSSAIVGDIMDVAELKRALNGVHVVIHCAAIVDVSVFPDYSLLQKLNVQGTQNVVNACLDCGVSCLVFTSTVDVLIGSKDIIYGDESLVPPRKLLFDGYGGTKLEAERLVLDNNGRQMKHSGSSLNVLVLRPTCMYGEGDPYFVKATLAAAKQYGGKLQRIGNGAAKFQSSYAGNIAYGHVCALYAMKRDPSVCGSVYILTDDTPVKSSFDVIAPFMACRGYKTSSHGIPYVLMYCIFWIVELFLKGLRPLKKINLSTSLASIMYINHTFCFRRDLAEQRLNYRPKYSYDEGVRRSVEFYKSLEL